MFNKLVEAENKLAEVDKKLSAEGNHLIEGKKKNPDKFNKIVKEREKINPNATRNENKFFKTIESDRSLAEKNERLKAKGPVRFGEREEEFRRIKQELIKKGVRGLSAESDIPSANNNLDLNKDVAKVDEDENKLINKSPTPLVKFNRIVKDVEKFFRASGRALNVIKAFEYYQRVGAEEEKDAPFAHERAAWDWGRYISEPTLTGIVRGLSEFLLQFPFLQFRMCIVELPKVYREISSPIR